MSQEDEFDFYWKDMSDNSKKELVKFYRSHGSCYRKVISRMATIYFQWLFLLNGGGLLLTTTVIGNCIASHTFNDFNKGYMIKLIVLFILGLFSIFIACLCEQKRFEKRGRILDQQFKEFNFNKIKGKELIDWVKQYKTIIDYLVFILQSLSAVFFTLGAILSIKVLIAI